MDFLFENWAEVALALIALAGTITGLTESTEDDKIVDVLRRIVNAIVFGKAK